MINVFIYYKVKGISLFTIKNLKYFLQHLLSYPQYKSPVKEKRQKPLFKRLPTGGWGGVGTRYILGCLGGEVWPGPSYPDPV